MVKWVIILFDKYLIPSTFLYINK